MKKLLLLRGLPASGKSTYAKETGFKRINKDDIRSMLDDGKWSRANEKLVLKIRDKLIELFMDCELNIVIDDTNFSETHKNRMNELISLHNRFLDKEQYELEEKFIDTPLEVCIERDKNRKECVGEKVIMDMYNKYFNKCPQCLKYKPTEKNTYCKECFEELKEL